MSRTNTRFLYIANQLLAQAEKPLTTPQILDRLRDTKRRNVPTKAQLNNLMRCHPKAFNDAGSTTGHYILKLWTCNHVACSIRCSKIYGRERGECEC